ncbi:DGQHR domain-containing protein [Candidatus Uhrbacteria bacterium]|nr:DGQHR domain-containing protein [Candidatus Uhrbacteria bacterium]
MSLKMIEIPGISVMKQGEQYLLVFVVPAQVLVEIGITLRFNEHPLGVNRGLTVHRAKDILAHMKAGKSNNLMRDPIQGCLYVGDGHEWIFDEKNRVLRGEVETDPDNRLDACFLVIDDGQHRFAALEMLSGENRQHWSFTVIAGMNMSVEERTELFMQGEKRQKVSPRLLLQMMDANDTFANESTATAYRMAKALNEVNGSPLKGKIYFEQGPRVPSGMVSVSSLLGQLKYCVGKNSRLIPYTSEQQRQALLNLFIAASRQWPQAWGQEDKTLGKHIGYLTLITLLARSGNLHSLLKEDLSLDSFKKAMEFAKGFRWEQAGVKDGSINHNRLAVLLDDHIGQAIAASQADLKK